MPRLHLTDGAVERLKLAPAGRRVFYRDDKTKGLGVMVTSQSKTFIWERRIDYALHRERIDDVRAISVEAARAAAEIRNGSAAKGEDLKAKKAERRRRHKSEALDLREGIGAYIKARAAASPPKIGPATKKDYEALRDRYLGPWLDKPLASFTDETVVLIHARVSKLSPYKANYVGRLLRAVFNFHDDVTGLARNPVRILSKKGLWNEERARSRYVEEAHLPGWWAAVEALDSMPHARDYLKFLLLTGLRRSEGVRLSWSDVDLKGRAIRLADTKNRMPLELPLSDYLVELLSARMQKVGPVFPECADPRHALAAVSAESGVEFTLHDLRRSFASYAQACNIDRHLIKRLLNHKQRDVTGKHYVQIPLSLLRGPMQKITDYTLKAAGIERPSNIVALPGAKVAA